MGDLEGWTSGRQDGTFAGVEPGGLAVLALVVIPRRPLGGEDVERGQPLPPHRPPQRAQRQPQRHPPTSRRARKRATAFPAGSCTVEGQKKDERVPGEIGDGGARRETVKGMEAVAQWASVARGSRATPAQQAFQPSN